MHNKQKLLQTINANAFFNWQDFAIKVGIIWKR